MGRKPLIWYTGAIYHTTTRGNKILSYFNENDKRKSYKSFVESAIKTRLD